MNKLWIISITIIQLFSFTVIDNYSIREIMQKSYNLKGQAIFEEIKKKNNYRIILYNDKNCSVCFEEMKKSKNESLYLLVLPKTTQASRYILNKRYKKFYTDIFYFEKEESTFMSTDSILTKLLNNELITPASISRNESSNFQYISYEQLFPIAK